MFMDDVVGYDRDGEDKEQTNSKCKEVDKWMRVRQFGRKFRNWWWGMRGGLDGEL